MLKHFVFNGVHESQGMSRRELNCRRNGVEQHNVIPESFS
jgi:hypothetical protein